MGVNGLAVEYIEPGGAQSTGSERLRQSSLIDQSATGRIHKNSAGAHTLDPLPVDEIGRLGRQRNMKRNDIGLAQQGAQGPKSTGGGWIGRRIRVDYFGVQRGRDTRQGLAHGAVAN